MPINVGESEKGPGVLGLKIDLATVFRIVSNLGFEVALADFADEQKFQDFSLSFRKPNLHVMSYFAVKSLNVCRAYVHVAVRGHVRQVGRGQFEKKCAQELTCVVAFAAE